MNSVVVSPPNAIVFLMDPLNREVDIPEYIDGSLIASTASCVSVGTQAPVDGYTEITLANSQDEPVGLVRLAVFDIACPHGKVAVVTSELDVLLEHVVAKGRVNGSIWIDDEVGPAKVFFRINQAVL